jgi:hypothetical protein
MCGSFLCIGVGARLYKPVQKETVMEKKKTFSTMEIILVGVMVGSLILSFLQARQDERKR